MSRQCFVCAILFPACLGVTDRQASAQPQFWFDPLPELPGGASEVLFGDHVPCLEHGIFAECFSAGKALDGDGIWKAVVWTKEAGQPWEIETLPNPFGNTESVAFSVGSRSGNASCDPGEDCISCVRIGGYANNAPARVCFGGGNAGNPCSSDAECFPGGTCPPASDPASQPIVWTGNGVGPWTAEVLPLPPGAIGGSVLALSNCPRDCGTCPVDLSVGRIDLVDGSAKAVAWRWDEVNQTWTVELLPDHGPGFASEAKEIGQSEPDPISLKSIGGYVQTETSPQVPCVWEEQPDGGFERVDLPLAPGAYSGSISAMPSTEQPVSDMFVSVGHNASIGGLGDLHRGVLYGRENGLWGAPLELMPVPAERDAKATGVAIGTSNSPDGVTVVGHSYVKFHEEAATATLWEVGPAQTVATYDLNDLTINRPSVITFTGEVRIREHAGDFSITSTFRYDASPSMPHAGVLILLSGTDCNKNGQDDALDLYHATSRDGDANGVPDECEPRFWFEALPDLSGGASEAFSVASDISRVQWPMLTYVVAGHSLDGDHTWKAAAWVKIGPQPAQIHLLPNPMGNTMSVARSIDRCNGNDCWLMGGHALNAGGAPVPVIWTGGRTGPWTPEIITLPGSCESGGIQAVFRNNVHGSLHVAGWCDDDGGSHTVGWFKTNSSNTWQLEFLSDTVGKGHTVKRVSFEGTIMGGEALGDSGFVLPTVWQTQQGGGFEQITLPMSPGSYQGRVSKLAADFDVFAAGYEALPGGIDFYRGTLYERRDHAWLPAVSLQPLPGLRDSRALAVTAASLWHVVGFSYMEPAPGQELATLWQGVSGNSADPAAFALDDLTYNLPPGVSLSVAHDVLMESDIYTPGNSYSIVGVSADQTQAISNPHAFLLTSFPARPQQDVTFFSKSRFISFAIPGPSVESALRVHLVSLHHVNPPYSVGPSIPFTSFEGQVRWVGPPVKYVESSSTGTLLHAATLQCTPHYHDWTTVGLLHVTGSAIVPSSIYEVENLAAACMGAEESCPTVSDPLEIRTTRWADIEMPFSPPSLTVQPDIADVSALVNKFRSAAGAPIKARALLVGTDQFGNINIVPDLSFSHIAACVDAFRGQGYPYTIQTCP